MNLTAAQLDRACGVLLATAAGDALGAPYEFGPPRGIELPVEMTGGGSFGWGPGEWTDDTSMAIAIAEVAATGQDLRADPAQDLVVARWSEWAKQATDVGIQTRAVLSACSTPTASAARSAAQRHHQLTGRSGGNGSLMRTAPVALAYLDDPDGLVTAARAISELTHHDPEAGEACVLWCLAIRHAVLTGVCDLRSGLGAIPPESRERWSQRLVVAEQNDPAHFSKNGWVVEALQGAWSAISRTPTPIDDPSTFTFRADHLRSGLDAAVRGGRDTDTVAAIAGGLLGAVHGASAVPAPWRRKLHGWPGLGADDVVALATAITRRGAPDTFDYAYSTSGDLSALVAHPYDPDLLIGGVGALHALPDGVDAVVSLCRVGPVRIPSGVEHVQVRLIDRDGEQHNSNLGFVLADTVRLLEDLRSEGRTVLLHCVQAISRTPTVAALYGARHRGVTIETALRAVETTLPHAQPIASFRSALNDLHPNR